MRYSAGLRSSKRPHILQLHNRSSLIAAIWFAIFFLVLFWLVDLANLDSRALFDGFIASTLRMTLAYVIALVISLLFALLVSVNQTVENIFLPILDVLQSFPSFALFPLLVHALKNSPEVVIIGVLVIATIWPIFFALVGGIKNRRQDLEEAATIFGAIGVRRLLFFTFPTLLPAIVTGSIVGWGDGWELIIGAELLVRAQVGIGSYLGILGDSGQNTLLAFGIVILMLLLFIINKVVWLPLLHRSTEYSTEN